MGTGSKDDAVRKGVLSKDRARLSRSDGRSSGRWIVTAIGCALSACATPTVTTYNAPLTVTQVRTFTIIDKPRAQAWDALVVELGKSFFVVNNMDRSSGFMNISYSGDPQDYVECGFIEHSGKLANGQPAASRFPGNQSNVRYVAVAPSGAAIGIDRKMTLDGRVNVVVQEDGAERTRLNVTVRYAVTRSTQAMELATGRQAPPRSETVSFNTNGQGVFSDTDGNPLRCHSKGKFEETILQMVK